MWSISALTLLLAILQITVCAPVTKYQTVTAITNADGSPYTWSPNQVANEATPTATVAAQAAATTPSTASSSGSNSFMGFLNSLASMLSDSGSSGTSTETGTGVSGTSSDSSSSSGSGSSWGSLFSSLLEKLGGSSGSTKSSGSSGASSGSSGVSSGSGSSSSSSGSGFGSSAAASPSTKAPSSSSSSSDSSSSDSSDSGSSSSGDVYDAIYNSSEDIDKDFAKAILDSHNKYRALHGVSALSWASGPYSYAKNNADNYDCSGVLTHTHGQYGENLAAGFSSGPSAVQAWYVEGETYDYSAHNEYNHFTQLVWKASTQVGCAYKDCSAEGWGKYVVCEYSPVGNVIGQEADNVLPLTS